MNKSFVIISAVLLMASFGNALESHHCQIASLTIHGNGFASAKLSCAGGDLDMPGHEAFTSALIAAKTSHSLISVKYQKYDFTLIRVSDMTIE